MPVRPTALLFIALLFTALVLAHPRAAYSQDSKACDAKKLCSSGSACVVGGSLTNDPRPGEIPGMVSWHSEVYGKNIVGPINKEAYCYYRVIRLNDPAALPLFWRPAGLKYLGTKAGDEKGCVFACTESEWDAKRPTSPIKGTIEYQKKGQSKYADSWGPQAGWTATDEGDLKAVPDPTVPGSGSKTLLSLESSGVRIEFETRVLPDGRARYSVRNLGRPVRVVWNIPKSDALAGVEGPFTRGGMKLGSGETYEHDVGISQSGGDVRITQWQTQARVLVEDAPAVVIAIPAVGPSNGNFETSPIEFWQQAGSPR
jgi:hypothetical protein